MKLFVRKILPSFTGSSTKAALLVSHTSSQAQRMNNKVPSLPQNHHCRQSMEEETDIKKNREECKYCYYKHASHECDPCRYLGGEELTGKQLKKVDYFQFFCFEKRFDIDLNELSRRFKEYQKFIHPDKFQLTLDRKLQSNAHELSSYANNAYFTLLNDLQRARYLLSLTHPFDNKNTKQATTSPSASNIPASDNPFLQKVFEMRLEISQSETLEELFAQQVDLQTQLDDKMERIASLFNQRQDLGVKNDMQVVEDEIKRQVEEAEYLEKMLQEIEIKEGQLKGDGSTV